MWNAVAAAPVFVLQAETAQEKGKRIVNECLDALGGDRYLNMENREEAGRAYSFYREQLSGPEHRQNLYALLSGVQDTAHELAQRERAELRQEGGLRHSVHRKRRLEHHVSAARSRSRPTALSATKKPRCSDIFYILRVRMHEPG